MLGVLYFRTYEVPILPGCQATREPPSAKYYLVYRSDGVLVCDSVNVVWPAWFQYYETERHLIRPKPNPNVNPNLDSQ